MPRILCGLFTLAGFAVFPLYFFLPFSPHLGRKGRTTSYWLGVPPSEAGLEPAFPRNAGSALFGSKGRGLGEGRCPDL